MIIMGCLPSTNCRILYIHILGSCSIWKSLHDTLVINRGNLNPIFSSMITKGYIEFWSSQRWFDLGDQFQWTKWIYNQSYRAQKWKFIGVINMVLPVYTLKRAPCSKPFKTNEHGDITLFGGWDMLWCNVLYGICFFSKIYVLALCLKLEDSLAMHGIWEIWDIVINRVYCFQTDPPVNQQILATLITFNKGPPNE